MNSFSLSKLKHFPPAGDLDPTVVDYEADRADDRLDSDDDYLHQ